MCYNEEVLVGEKQDSVKLPKVVLRQDEQHVT